MTLIKPASAEVYIDGNIQGWRQLHYTISQLHIHAITITLTITA